MTKFTLPYFGEIDLTQYEPYRSIEADYKGKKVRMSIQLEEQPLTLEHCEAMQQAIQNLDKFEKKCKAYLQKNYKDGGVVKEYLEHHLSVMDQAAFAGLIDFNDPKIAPIDQLYQLITFKSYWLSPMHETVLGVFDYVISSRDFTNYVLSFQINKAGKIINLCMES